MITAEEFGASPDRPADRQAVVVIHGIGEQHPMTTLRGLVEGLFGRASGDGARYYSKPDRISDTLELRRISVGAGAAGRPTDFYEFYWAHLMKGSSLQHVADWFFVLLWRPWRSIPPRLRAMWCASWLVTLGVLGSFGWSLWHAQARPALGATGLLAVLLFVLPRIATRFALGHVGDAARYLRPAPENIAMRAAIRAAGLELLRNLHTDPMQRYGRIVLVGHSLGSVIAYDIVTHLWQEMHWQHDKPVEPEQPEFEAMARSIAAHAGGAAKVDDFQALQRRLLAEERRLGMPWKITDLVTLGSPLTYAGFLLADERYPLAERRKDRELPTCPPQLEDGRDIGFLSPRYAVEDGSLSRKQQLHHAAAFACTRWTNLHFDTDLVAGRLAESLGGGIKDIHLAPASRLGRTPASHVLYWSASEPEACRQLKDSLRLAEAP